MGEKRERKSHVHTSGGKRKRKKGKRIEKGRTDGEFFSIFLADGRDRVTL